MSDRSPDKDVPTLLGDIGGEVANLVAKGMEFARVELRTELSKGVKATASLSSAAVATLIGLLFVSSAAAWGLPEGFAFLIVGGAYLAVAGVLAVVGRRRIADVDPVPRQTLET